MSPYLLLLLGISLIFIEFFLPGIVLGSIGVALVIASLVAFALQTSSSLYLALYAAAVVLSLYAVFKYALRRMRGSESFFATSDQAGTRAGTFDVKLIGSTGIAETDLRPAGLINVAGNTLQALSQSDFIPKGSRVLIIGGEGSELIVKEQNLNQ